MTKRPPDTARASMLRHPSAAGPSRPMRAARGVTEPPPAPPRAIVAPAPGGGGPEPLHEVRQRVDVFPHREELPARPQRPEARFECLAPFHHRLSRRGRIPPRRNVRKGG